MRRYPKGRCIPVLILILGIFGGTVCLQLFFSEVTLPTRTTVTLPVIPSYSVIPRPPMDLEYMYYRRQETIVNPFPYVLLTSPRTACPDGVVLVIVVHSHTSYRDRRDAIRHTWGSYGNGQQGEPRSTRLVFALGIDANVSADAVRAESKIYDDIIQGNFVDVYKNMTLKSLLGLKWVSEQCARVPYMLKSDDDTFISIPYLIEILQAKRPTRSIMGPNNNGSWVYREGRWAVSKELFPFNWYPNYESGSGYVITVDIVRELYETSAYVTALHIEDVYVTGILAKIIGAKHIQRKGFAYWFDNAPKACDFVTRKKISSTNVTANLMYTLWKDMKGLTAEICGRTTASLRDKLLLYKYFIAY